MAEKITDSLIKGLVAPATGNRIVYDTEISGFGVRTTAGGAVSFVLNYRFQGRERRITIGPYGRDLWTVVRARKDAGELRRRIANGDDPLGEREEAIKAPTVADLCARFEKEHLPKKRPSTAVQYRQIIANDVLPTFGARKVASITYTDVDALHRKITEERGAPYRANRVVALLSKMFALSIRWHMRTDNPAKGI